MGKNTRTALVCGMGTNNGKYYSWIDGKNVIEYDTWRHMLYRCTENYWKSHPSYIGVTCSENFKSYSFFYEWCHNQKGFGCRDENDRAWHLDKDLLSKGNRVYSENVCCFVPVKINSLLTSCASARGSSFIGVCIDKRDGRYKAKCLDGGKQIFLGYHTREIDAFNAYKKYKEALIKRVANEYKDQLDPRAYDALLNYTVEITD